MIALNGRSIAATTLSLWLGALACLLGCASPAKATDNPAAGRANVVRCPESDGNAGDSCCQRNHNPVGSKKSRHHAMSCCPTETALTQKQNLVLPALAVDFVAILPLAHVDASRIDFDLAGANGEVPFQTGRDILQQAHLLRI
jgi:hypothetical protein